MNIIDSLLDNNQEEFRNQINSALFVKIKDALAKKRVEVASSLYDNTDEEECQNCPPQE
jgi:hypothetical protein